MIIRLGENRYSDEQWALGMEAARTIVNKAIADNDAKRAAWAASMLSFNRTMLLFSQEIEKLVWRGYGVEQLRDALRLWETNRDRTDEQFWQESLRKHAIVLSQLFAFPVLILGDTPYVGGTRIDYTGGRRADFLVANELTDNVAIVEIKTPATRLVSGSYRKFPNVSRDLTGTVIQVLRNKDALLKNLAQVRYHSGASIDAYDPTCVIIIGTLSAELTDNQKRQTFELYRQSLQHVQVVTYDELFGRIKNLLDLLDRDG